MREAGILLAISSLPSRYGIGCLDSAAYEFVDQLAAAGQHIWQILPVGPTGYGDSPYQSFSTFAGNPYFISLEDLIRRGWVSEEECESADMGSDPRHVDYGKLFRNRFRILHTSYEKCDILTSEEFTGYCLANKDWLDDYALFMAIKDAHGGAGWMDWEPELALREPEALKEAGEKLADEVQYYKYLQYMFFSQFEQLKTYANSKGIRLIGDIPIYVSADSSDAWAEPELFQLNEDRRLKAVAGCPPDAFAADGQLWGNPLYDWDYHKKTGYSWWIRRIRHCYHTCDILRIDHFRGFDEYYSIPAGDKTAANGRWEKGPGIKLFDAIKAALGEAEIIAEDLGYVTDSVRQLVRDTGFAGIKVFEFAFDSRDTGAASDYLPHNYPVNCAAYTGTHDNATLTAWIDEISEEEKQMVRDYIASVVPDRKLYWPIIVTVLRSVARIAVVPMQDYLGYGAEARMNRPGASGSNWQWRLLPREFSPELAAGICRITKLTGRKENL